jgi:NAD(P)-dependent dehydrogenase (short-subunit alcohol dehydrogenase family)
MELECAGKVAIVTGAGRGIGLAVTQALSAAGATVIAGTRTITPELAQAVDQHNGKAIALDLTEPGAAAHLVTAAGDTIDILVNNAGAAPARLDGFLSITDEMWSATLELDLMVAVRMLRHCLPALERSRGSVVNIGSINSRLPDPLVLDYCAAKAALANVAKALSKEFGSRGIRINTVDPGPVATDLWLGRHGVAATVGARRGVPADDIAAAAASGTATGRFTHPDEVADLVLFLAGPRAANITGTNAVIDGGMLTTL